MEKIVINKITKSRISGRCVLVLSDGRYISALIDTVLHLNLDKNKEIAEQEIQIINNEIQINKLKSYSLRLCEGFSRSEFQIKQKLLQKKYPLKEIEQIIKRLKELGLINDKKFAENFINYSIKKNWGLDKIIRELNIRKVKSTDYQEFLEDISNDTDFFIKALNSAEKKMRLLSSKPIDKQKNSIFRHLISKGYSYDIVKDVIHKLFNE